VLGSGEDWCPDVHGHLPVVARMASSNPEKIILWIFPPDEQERQQALWYWIHKMGKLEATQNRMGE